jgi:hypothetical protein
MTQRGDDDLPTSPPAAPLATQKPDLDQILCAISSLTSATLTLTEHARELADDPLANLSPLEDVPEYLADVLAAALDALPGDRLTDDYHQLRAAIARFLEGWAG